MTTNTAAVLTAASSSQFTNAMCVGHCRCELHLTPLTLLLLLLLIQADGAELVIALTHMRLPNDVKLATQVEGIDAVLGGHDHHVQVSQFQDMGSKGHQPQCSMKPQAAPHSTTVAMHCVSMIPR